jgi:RND family efflux transporter MFP subunit
MLEIAKERAKLAEIRYQFSQEKLAAAFLKAPFTGTVSSFGKQRGDNVGAYETIGEIADNSEISVHVMVPTTVVNMIAPGTPAVVKVAGREYETRVTFIDSGVTPWQGESAYRVTVAFDTGQDLTFDINQSVDVTIAGESRENVLLLPVEAVDIFPGQAYVDIVDGNNLQRVPVEVGISDGMNIEILNGIEEGQIVALP